MVSRTLRRIPQGFHDFLHRLRVMPFESALAITTIFTGIAAFTDKSISSRLFVEALPLEIAVLFNVTHLLSGFSLFAAIGWGYRNLEAFGLLLLASSLFARLITLWVVAGWHPVTATALIQSLIFGLACLARIYTLFKRQDVTLIDLEVGVVDLTGEHQVGD